MKPLSQLIFASRWLQLPLYLGLILAQAVYVFQFWGELIHLIEAVLGSKDALASLVTSLFIFGAYVVHHIHNSQRRAMIFMDNDSQPVRQGKFFELYHIPSF